MPDNQKPSVSRMVHITASDGTCVGAQVIAVYDDNTVGLVAWVLKQSIVSLDGGMDLVQEYIPHATQDLADLLDEETGQPLWRQPETRAKLEAMIGSPLDNDFPKHTPFTWHWPERV